MVRYMLSFGLGQSATSSSNPVTLHRVIHPKGTVVSTVDTGTGRVKRGLAEMLKGGVIMDVVTADQAKIAEDAGAVAVMALERVPADIRAQGGVSRMSDPDMIDGIIEAVSIPVMAKARIGHFVEAQVLQELGVDYIDESEVLSPADYVNHIDKWGFTVPFVCRRDQPGRSAPPHQRRCRDDPLEGRGGNGRRLGGHQAHPQDLRRDQRPAFDDEGRAVRRSQGAAGPVRTRRRGRRDRQAPRGSLRRGRRGHPCGRGDDDAARRRRRLRRLGPSSSRATRHSARPRS